VQACDLRVGLQTSLMSVPFTAGALQEPVLQVETQLDEAQLKWSGEARTALRRAVAAMGSASAAPR
jgi:hypothetical protein